MLVSHIRRARALQSDVVWSKRSYCGEKSAVEQKCNKNNVGNERHRPSSVGVGGPRRYKLARFNDGTHASGLWVKSNIRVATLAEKVNDGRLNFRCMRVDFLNRRNSVTNCGVCAVSKRRNVLCVHRHGRHSVDGEIVPHDKRCVYRIFERQRKKRGPPACTRCIIWRPFTMCNRKGVFVIEAWLTLWRVLSKFSLLEMKNGETTLTFTWLTVSSNLLYLMERCTHTRGLFTTKYTNTSNGGKGSPV